MGFRVNRVAAGILAVAALAATATAVIAVPPSASAKREGMPPLLEALLLSRYGQGIHQPPAADDKGEETHGNRDR